MFDRDQVSVQRLIPAPAERIFDVLADPARHQEFDGSGLLVQSRSRGPRRLGLGDTFGMDMRLGVPYATRNVVSEYEEDRLIAWRTLAPPALAMLATGRTWRYELTPVDGGTLVRETWDISTEAPLARPLVRRLAALTRTTMARSLERLEEIVAAAA